MVWAGEPQPDSVKGQEYLQKICSGVHYFLADFKFFNLVPIVLWVIPLVIRAVPEINLGGGGMNGNFFLVVPPSGFMQVE